MVRVEQGKNLMLHLVCVIALVCLWPLWPLTASCAIYGYQDESGDFHFTNIRPANKKYTVIIETREAEQGQSRGIAPPWRSDQERQNLIKQAKDLLGVPYKLGGDGLKGIDCSAFVRKMFSAFDVSLPRTAREQYDVGKKIERNQLTTGDLVFFRTKQSDPHPTHVGIFMGNDQFIHASALGKGGVRIDSLSSEFYDRRFIGATRIKPLPDNSSDVIITASK